MQGGRVCVTLGQAGEDVAAQYLTANGFEILTRNFRTRLGEIDIIAKAQKTIIFVEVKTRTSIAFGYPAEYVTRSKQQKLLKAAVYYLHACGADNAPARFDVLEVLPTQQGLAVANHIINAFGR
jgi:putative endonuclease